METGGKEEMCMVVGKGLESGELYQLSVDLPVKEDSTGVVPASRCIVKRGKPELLLKRIVPGSRQIG